MNKTESDFSVVPNDRKRDSEHKFKNNRKFHLYIRIVFFTMEMVQTLAEVANGIFIPGDIQNLTDHGAGQPAVADPALSGWDGLNDLQKFLLTTLI